MKDAAVEMKEAEVEREDALRVARECARQIGEAAPALRVVLFGSTARGARGARDLDFLAIVADDAPGGRRAAWRRANEAVYKSRVQCRNLRPVDIIVQTESQVKRWRDSPYTVVKPALDEGVELWRAGKN